MKHLVIRMGGNLDDLVSGSRRIREFLSALGAGEAILFASDLCLEELVTNTIKYGCTERESLQIEATAKWDGETLFLRLADNAQPFNPILQADPDIHRHALEGEAGGLGIHFVKNLVDSIQYERSGAQNVITIRKTA